MSVNLSILAGAGWQFFNNDGIPLAGGLLYTYAAGTSTPQTTYTTSSGSIANSNPVVLDSAGRVPYEIWLTSGYSYKFVLKDSSSVLIGTWDNVDGVNDFSALENTSNVTQGDALIGFKQANYGGVYPGSVGSTVHQKLQDVVSAFDFLPLAQIAYIQARNTGSQDATVVTAGINAALATGRGVLLPKGKYSINGSLQLTAEGQVLRGEGRYDSTVLLWTGGTGDTFIETNNTNLKWHCEVRELRLTFNADNMTGIDWSNCSYGTIENVNIDGYGNNVVGVRLKGTTAGDRPYYNTFRQVDIASNNIGGVTSGSIGWYGQRTESLVEPGNFNGPNANQWFGGRCSGMNRAFYFEDAIGNSFFGCVSESIKTAHYEFGVSTPYYPSSGGAAVFSATVNQLTDNSSIPMTTNQYVNGMIYILSGTGAGQYRQILTNTTSVFTVYPYWDVVPDNTSTYQIFPEAGQSNTLQGCYGEGDSISAPDYLKLNPGATSTYIYGGIQSSIGKIVNDYAPRVSNHFNPEGWKDPVPFTFSTVDLPKNSSSLALAPVGWLRNNLSIPGYWHVSAIDVGINGAITSGTIKIWVTQNGTKLNTNPDMQITSLSSFNAGGGSIKQGIYSTNAIVSTSGYSQFGVVVDTDSILLPDATLDLYITLYIVSRG